MKMKFKYVFLCLFLGVVFVALGAINTALVFAGLFFLILGTILLIFQFDKSYNKN